MSYIYSLFEMKSITNGNLYEPCINKYENWRQDNILYYL